MARLALVSLVSTRLLFFVLSAGCDLDGRLAHCDLGCYASGIRAVLHERFRVDGFFNFLGNESIESLHAMALLYHFVR